VLLAILLLGGAIRLYQPTFRSLWGDEAHSWYLAQLLLVAPMNYFAALIADTHLPVYFMLLSAWIKLMGTSEFGLRLLSILLGTLTLPLMYLLSQKIFNQTKLSLISVYLLALSPLAIMHSQEIRLYGLLLMLSIVSTYFFYSLAVEQEVSGKKVLLYLTATTLFLYTHLFAVLLIGAQFVWVAMAYLTTKNRKLFWTAGATLASLFLALPFYLPLILSNIGNVVGQTSDMAFASFPWYLKLPLYLFVLNLGETVAPWNWLLILPMGLFLFVVLISTPKLLQDKRNIFCLFMLVVPLLLAAFLIKATLPKYLIICLPFLILLYSRVLNSFNNALMTIMMLTILSLGFLGATRNYYLLQEYHNANQIEPWRLIAGEIAANYQTGDIVVGTNHHVVGRLLQYYLNGNRCQKFLVYDLQGQQLAESELANANRLWFVAQIQDDRAFPLGYPKKFLAILRNRYLLQRQLKYVPYDQTLVAKLGINRHVGWPNRVVLQLYKSRYNKSGGVK